MTEQEKAKLIIEISKLHIVCKEYTAGKYVDTVACVRIEDVLKLIRDWGVEE